MSVPRRKLGNKPLLEAIFELHWQSKEDPIDLNSVYPLWLGGFYKAVESRYPFHEPLAGYGLPSDVIGSIICNRFRSASGEWPLIQLGPQIATLNDTSGYSWDDNFYQEIVSLAKAINSTHPLSSAIGLSKLVLRYVDAVDMDALDDNVLQFIQRHFGIALNVNPELFLDSSLEPLPLSADVAVEYSSSNPIGSLKLRFSNGSNDRHSTLIWETLFVSNFGNSSLNVDEISLWAREAHDRTSGSFFNLIGHDLCRRFD
jgi:uncharacterized protein (TIGR04255 family)